MVTKLNFWKTHWAYSAITKLSDNSWNVLSGTMTTKFKNSEEAYEGLLEYLSKGQKTDKNTINIICFNKI